MERGPTLSSLMKKEQDTIKMLLDICGERLVHSVPVAKLDFARHVEKEINDVYSSWRKRFAGKTDREIMAMVAFRYASYYNELLDRYEEASALAVDCLALLKKGPLELSDSEE